MGTGREVNDSDYLDVGGGFVGGVVLCIGSLGGSVLGREDLGGGIVSYFRSSITIFFYSAHLSTRILGSRTGPCISCPV